MYDPLNQVHRDTRQLVSRLMHEKQTDEAIVRRLHSSVGASLKDSQWIVRKRREELVGIRRKQGASTVWIGLIIAGFMMAGSFLSRQPYGFLQGTRATVKQDLGWFRWRSG